MMYKQLEEWHYTTIQNPLKVHFLISTAIVPKVIPSVLHMNATGCSD